MRLDFKERYHNFQRLIHANNKALDVMAEIEQALQGERPFGMTFVRSRCTAALVNVYKMIRKMRLLAPDKYDRLSVQFGKIQHQIDQILTDRRVAADRRLIIPLSEINKDMVDLVGSKMANLGEIKNSIALQVPGGFVITAHAYDRFIAHNDLRSEINRLMQSADPNDMENLFRLNARLHRLILEAELPKELSTAILDAWQQTEEEADFEITAALRSSALGEDESGSSFAGMHQSALNVSLDHVLQTYREIVASKYSLQAISYRLHKGFKDEDISMCVGCLVMVDAIAGGVIYTRNPVDINDDDIYINAAWGLPKAVVDGSIDNDLFVVSRHEPMQLIRQDIRDKQNKFVCFPLEGVCRIELSGDASSLPALNADQALELGRLAIQMETYYGTPQDIEWAIGHDHQIYILQCRPLQQQEATTVTIEAETAAAAKDVITSGGITASPGAASGKVFRVEKELDLLQFPEGAVLLSHSALPRWATILNRAAAVVTEHGGFAGHLANVAREFKVPALFAVPDAFDLLPSSQEITVDATGRRIYQGRVESLLQKRQPTPKMMADSPVFKTLERAGELIVPLNLLDPEAPEFQPANCRSLHDITRFIHEKSVYEMFSFGKEHNFSERAGKQLFHHVPMHWWILNLDDGLKEEVDGKYVKLENIQSIPMLAFWEGFTAIEWDGPPAIDGKGLMSVMFHSTSNTSLVVGRPSAFADQNYFMISKNFCHLSSRLGYHFSTLEAYITDRPVDNYIKFQFKGGAADFQRRLQRVVFIKSLLEQFGFTVTLKEDNLLARIDDHDQTFMIHRLEILGYLSIHTRQIDMIMTNPAAVNQYREKYKQDIHYLLTDHQRKFLVDI